MGSPILTLMAPSMETLGRRTIHSEGLQYLSYCLEALSITLGRKSKLSQKFIEFSSGAVGRLVSHPLDHMALGPHSPTYGRGLT